jgi:hypothetical protein
MSFDEIGPIRDLKVQIGNFIADRINKLGWTLKKASSIWDISTLRLRLLSRHDCDEYFDLFHLLKMVTLLKYDIEINIKNGRSEKGEITLNVEEELKTCDVCKGPINYSAKWDAYYCSACDEWKEGTCTDEYCEFCNRPSKPSEESDDL